MLSTDLVLLVSFSSFQTYVVEILYSQQHNKNNTNNNNNFAQLIVRYFSCNKFSRQITFQ